MKTVHQQARSWALVASCRVERIVAHDVCWLAYFTKPTFAAIVFFIVYLTSTTTTTKTTTTTTDASSINRVQGFAKKITKHLCKHQLVPGRPWPPVGCACAQMCASTRICEKQEELRLRSQTFLTDTRFKQELKFCFRDRLRFQTLKPCWWGSLP